MKVTPYFELSEETAKALELSTSRAVHRLGQTDQRLFGAPRPPEEDDDDV